MTSVQERPALPEGRVPPDTFQVRLAIVRAVMGWNYDQAARATGIGSETWRLWEKGKRHCTTLESTCRAISAATGISYKWLMLGGSLSDPSVAALNSGWRYRNVINSHIRPVFRGLGAAA